MQGVEVDRRERALPVMGMDNVEVSQRAVIELDQSADLEGRPGQEGESQLVVTKDPAVVPVDARALETRIV